MTVQEDTISKIQRLPEPLVLEVRNFVEFLLLRDDAARWQAWQQFTETQSLAESDMPDYLSNLEDYEERLARGEIKW